MLYRNYKGLILVIVFLLVSNIVMLVYFLLLNKQSQRGRFAGRQSARTMAERLKAEVGFTPAQSIRFDSLVKQYEADLRPVIEQSRSNRKEMQSRLSELAIPDSVLTPYLNRNGDYQRKADSLLIMHWHKVLKICSPEQRPKFIRTLLMMPRSRVKEGRAQLHKMRDSVVTQ